VRVEHADDPVPGAVEAGCPEEVAEPEVQSLRLPLPRSAFREVDDRDAARVAGGPAASDLQRAIRGPVVDHEDLEPVPRVVHRQDPLESPVEDGLLVAAGDHQAEARIRRETFRYLASMTGPEDRDEEQRV